MFRHWSIVTGTRAPIPTRAGRARFQRRTDGCYAVASAVDNGASLWPEHDTRLVQWGFGDGQTVVPRWSTGLIPLTPEPRSWLSRLAVCWACVGADQSWRSRRSAILARVWCWKNSGSSPSPTPDGMESSSACTCWIDLSVRACGPWRGAHEGVSVSRWAGQPHRE
jgi:hypothetical protein